MSDYRPPRTRGIRALNAAGRALRRLGLEPVSLELESLLARARRSTGLSDFGDEAFREPLSRLLAAWEAESRLSPLGRLIARRDTLRTLENRLRLVDERRRHPELAEERIEAPLFIVGLPRTGTSILHELMAQDPDNRTPMTWEVMWPCPRPEAASFRSDPRIDEAVKHFAAVDQLIPGFKRMHRMGAELPQECCMLMNHDFMSMQYHTSNRVTSYQDWLDGQDMTPTYASHRDQLQHLQSLAPARHWVLKSPQHLWSLDALLRVYPDARIVHTHRDPVKVAASVASLVCLLRGMSSDEIDPFEVGGDWAQRIAGGLDRAMDARDADGDERRCFDLQFRDYMADPIGTIRRIYAHFGRELSPRAAERMQSFLDAHPRDEHGRHEYTLEGYGLDLSHERKRFARYQSRLGIADEP